MFHNLCGPCVSLESKMPGTEPGLEPKACRPRLPPPGSSHFSHFLASFFSSSSTLMATVSTVSFFFFFLSPVG